MTRILLLRHGQSVANIEKFFAGQSNIQLTPLGVRQAELAAESMKDVHIDVIYSSELDRAYDTALPFARMRGLEVTRRAEFNEWHAGLWEGTPFDAIREAFPVEYNAWKNDLCHLAMPKGEDAYSVRERMGKAVEAIAEENEGKTVLVACHGGVIKTVPSYFAHNDDVIFNQTKVSGNCSITEVVFENGVGTVVRYGDDSHLGDIKSDAFII